MDLSRYIENTLLKPDALKDELVQLFKDAKEYGFKGVCVNPVNVEAAKEYLKDTNVKIVTVVGFPLGASTSQAKAFEAAQAVKAGADEIDMVINVSALKNNDLDLVKKDIETVKAACGKKVLKVIIETDLLTKEEIKTATIAACESGADFVKTSTGFVKNGVGAKVEDVQLMFSIASKYGVRIKASGGIKTKQQAEALIAAGATRLGTSSGVEIKD